MDLNRLTRLSRAWLIACLVLVWSDSWGSEDTDLASRLETEITESRKAARFQDALQQANELLSIHQSDESTPAYVLTSTKQLVATLELIVDLPLQSQQELAEADRLEDLIDEHWENAAYGDGIVIAERQLAIRRRILGDKNSDVSGTLSYLGWLHRRSGNMASAEAFFRESLDIDRAILGTEHPDVAVGQSNLAGLVGMLGDYASAETLFVESLHILRETLGEDDTEMATTLNNYASLLKKQGKYVAAGPLLREALRIRREQLGESHWRVANILNNLADLLTSQGDLAGPEPLYHEALAIYRARNEKHPNVGIALNNLANVRRKKGDVAEAERLYKEAIEIFAKSLGEEHWRYADGLSNLALVLEDKENFGEAESLHRRTLAIYRQIYGNEHIEVAITLNNLAKNLRRQRRYEQSEALYHEAIAIKRKILGGEHWSIVNSLGGLARVRIEVGDVAGAERYLSEAAAIYDAARLRAGAGIERATFRESPYLLLAACRLRLENGAGAWQAAERNLGRVLAELLFAAQSRRLTPEETARELALRKALSDLERKTAAYQKAARVDSTEESNRALQETRNHLLAVEAEWSEFQQEIAKKYPVAEGQTYSLGRVQEALDGGTAVLGWLDVEETEERHVSWAYVIRSEGPVTWARLDLPEGGGAGSYHRTRMLADALVSPGVFLAGVTRYAKEVWRERVAPVSRELDGIERLVVIPSGPMLGIPVETLVDDENRSLDDRYAVSYAPSATIYAWLAQRAGSYREGRGTLLVGDPPFNESHVGVPEEFPDTNIDSQEKPVSKNGELAHLTRLPMTRSEIDTIASVAPNPHVLLGRDASEQKLAEMARSGELEDFGVVHIATHAIIDAERPGRSALVLSQIDLPDPLRAAKEGRRIYDGLFTAGEIVREWTLDADLVTLSACETGLGKEVGGEGYIGFTHAFFQAGTRNLLVSLWKVEDQATALLMRRFYDNLFGPHGAGDDARRGRMGMAEALREAKQWLRSYTSDDGSQLFRHPFYWSGFVLVGYGD